MIDSRPILIAEDDVGMCEGLSRSLRREGFTVTLAADGLQALDRLRERNYRMVITDLEMPQVKGIEVLREVKKQSPAVPVVVITAYGSIGTAVEAMKEGAFDFLTKPFSSDALRDVVQRACTDRADSSLPSPARSAAQESGASLSGSKKLVCSSPGMAEILELARAVAPSKAAVLIQGESGTGKELLARYIHQTSPRAQRPFVAFNCAAIPESLLESELFGHEKGAFTGANQRKAGRFEQADGGTLLLDEISEMDHKLQAKLLRVLQEQAVDRVGGKDPVSIDVRVIATTNRDLPQSIRQGGFREDLYYRLNVILVRVPPLREQPDSIEALALHFIEVACRENGRETLRLTPAALSRLIGYAWPGNIRQLENVLARAVILAKGDEIGEDLTDLTSSDLPLTEIPVAVSSGQTVREMERSLILKTLETTSGNRTKAAIDTAAPTGVTTTVISETVDNATVYRLDISGTTTFTDSNNVLEALGVLKRSGLNTAQQVQGAVANLAGASPVTSATLFSAIDGTSIQTNETISITGTEKDGTAVSGTFTIDHGNASFDDLGDLETYIEGLYSSEVDVTYDAAGKLTVTQTTNGETKFTIAVVAKNEQGGALDFGDMSVVTRGRTGEVQAGLDSVITVDGVRMERSTNSIDDAVTGVTLDLLKASATDVVNVQVDRDLDQLQVDVENLFNDYNSIIDFINAQSSFDPDEDDAPPPLLGEFTLVTFKEMIQADAISTVLGLPADRNILSHVGIETDKEGKMSLDATKFKAAFKADFLGSRRIFIGEGTTTDGDVDFLGFTDKTSAGTFEVNITQAATQASVTGSTDLSGGLGADDTVTITDKTTSREAVVALTSGQSLTSIVNALNSEFGTEVAQVVTGSVVNTTDGSTPIIATTTFSSIFGASVAANDTIDISGTTKLGKSVSGVFTISDPAVNTVGQLLAAIETTFENAVSATVDTSGKIVITDSSVGDSNLSVKLDEKNEGGGSLDFGLTADPSEVTTTGRYKMEITASASGNFLKLDHNNYGSALGFTISQTSNQLGITDQEYVGVDVAGTLNGETATGSGRTLTGKAAEPNVEGLAVLVKLTAAELSSQGAAQGSVKITTGIAEQFARLIVEVTGEEFDTVSNTLAKGLLANKVDSLGDEIDNRQDQMDLITIRLGFKRIRLMNQFIAMEQSVARLRSIGDFLAQQLAVL